MRHAKLLELSLGTFCSGTDSPVHVWLALKDALMDTFGLDLQLCHEFSVEINAKKQDFLLKMYPGMLRLFEDATKMKGSQSWCKKTRSCVTIPSVKTAVGGFPCQDASGLNPKSSTPENRSCVAQDSCIQKDGLCKRPQHVTH
jgi:hypothetical protein